MTVVGYGMFSDGANANSASLFVKLDEYEDRESPDLIVDGVINKFYASVADIKDAIIMASNLPALMGASTQDGFEYMLQTTEGASPEDLVKTANMIIGEARKNPALESVMTFYRVDSPRISVVVDREKRMLWVCPCLTSIQRCRRFWAAFTSMTLTYTVVRGRS